MQHRRRQRGRRVVRENPHRINDFIRVSEVRLVGDNVEMGVYTTDKAKDIARELELDLVEISPNAEPPVCKIMDYRKFLFEKKKKEKEIKSKTQKTVIKEIRFGPNTDDHDFEFKAKHGEKFLKEGSKVRAFVFFRGRSIVFKDRGELLLLKLAQRLEEFGAVEQLPKLEGKKMAIVIAPKKKGK
ncbi:MAG: translation initiation factor IF-3 [Bacteroidota bacterium]|nr:translation initiation factor IF-3 [Bacteroidota bacterium]MEC8032889.1 translation initiation factor IF-3 [Bacteroidota bacterium]